MALVMPSADVSKLEQLKSVRAEQTSLLSDILSEALCAMKKQNSESLAKPSPKPTTNPTNKQPPRKSNGTFTNTPLTSESVPKIKPKPVNQKKKSKSQNGESMLKSVLTKQENRKRKREVRECNNPPLHHEVPLSPQLQTNTETKRVVKKVAAVPEPKAPEATISKGKSKKYKTKKSHKYCNKGGINLGKTMGSEVVLVLNEEEGELESGLELDCPTEWSVGTPRTVTTFLRRSFGTQCSTKTRPES